MRVIDYFPQWLQDPTFDDEPVTECKPTPHPLTNPDTCPFPSDSATASPSDDASVTISPSDDVATPSPDQSGSASASVSASAGDTATVQQSDPVPSLPITGFSATSMIISAVVLLVVGVALLTVMSLRRRKTSTDW